ncbi:hypothetical protein CNMCM8927_001751 [Aspergillus lentulus]|uniref:Rhodopsin domain-containing protein n=1 Tax=Aspergillus lentulus TaxID=293939 RepID=A0AAN5YHM1_ASPLE|nr:hypothetical protein CNMCM6069_009696 [Aspergillus lentulus]KAF4201292.1 hypothetical protein CNMCM8927_001751 [Aspergillus lentulus]
MVFLCLSFTAVALRCFVRLRLVKAFGWDDGLMVLAMLFNIWFAICGLAGSVAGIGKRFDQFDSVEDAHTALLHEQWWWLGQSAYVWVVATARISIAMLLLRLTAQRRESVVMYSVIGLTATVGLAFWLILTLQCDPVREFWQRTGRGHCIDTQYVLDIAYLYSATACLCDFTLGLFPVYLLRHLHTSRRTKWAIRVILSMGCIAGAAVAARIPYLPDYKHPDFLYATTGIAISSNIEAGLGIMAGSLITLRPLMRWLRDVSHRGIQHFRDIICKEAAESKHDYVIFSNIDEYTFLRDFDESQRQSYSDFFPQVRTLVARMPASEVHEEAHAELNNTLMIKLAAMNVRSQLRSLIGADVVTPTRTKKPHQSYKPVKFPADYSGRWPSMVIETAFSESQSKLANDARWWLNASGGELKTVITIAVQKKREAITIDKWEAISRPTRGDPGKMVPEVVQKVTMTREGGDAPVHITGAPLIIEFEKLFLRPAEEEKGERDVVFSHDNLAEIADLVWNGLSTSN